MTKEKPRNLAASVRQRLMNLAVAPQRLVQNAVAILMAFAGAINRTRVNGTLPGSRMVFVWTGDGPPKRDEPAAAGEQRRRADLQGTNRRQFLPRAVGLPDSGPRPDGGRSAPISRFRGPQPLTRCPQALEFPQEDKPD